MWVATRKMYFMFEKEHGDAIKLSLDRYGTKFTASIGLANKQDYDTIKNSWMGYYDLQFDKKESLYYISLSQPKVRTFA